MSLGSGDGVASRDTTFLLGGPDRWDGRFETPTGEAAWHGWFHYAPVDDYTQLNRDLPDDDPDQDNLSWQVNWRNFDPNEAPPGYRLDNLVVSPPVSLPEDLQQLVYTFDVGVNIDAMGRQMSYRWHVRSTADPEPAGLDLAPWVDHGFVYFGPPGYSRREEAVGDLLWPARAGCRSLSGSSTSASSCRRPARERHTWITSRSRL